MKQSIAFILYHTGETKALLPTMHYLVDQSEQFDVTIITVGNAAKANLPSSFSPLVITPSFIREGFGSNDSRHHEFSDHQVEEVVRYCHPIDHIVMGFPARIQEQIAAALPISKNRIIYFDMGHNEQKINAFMPHADTLIMTTLTSQNIAQQLVNNSTLAHRPQVLAAIHGDFTTWKIDFDRLKSDEKSKRAILEQLSLDPDKSPADKILLWSGGYDENEPVAFANFIDSYQQFRDGYTLRICLHPGLKMDEKNYSESLAMTISNYYFTPLRKAGFSEEVIEKVIAPISMSTFSVACVAYAALSSCSTVGQQMKYIGGRVKNVYVNDSIALTTGVKTAKSDEMEQILTRWQEKKRRTNSLDESTYVNNVINKLSTPPLTTLEVVLSLINSDNPEKQTGVSLKMI